MPRPPGEDEGGHAHRERHEEKHAVQVVGVDDSACQVTNGGQGCNQFHDTSDGNRGSVFVRLPVEGLLASGAAEVNLAALML